MTTKEPEAPLKVDPHAQLERAFIEEFLRERGHTLESVHELPEDEARALMAEASRYASIKLTEVEARAHFVDEVHGVTPPL